LVSGFKKYSSSALSTLSKLLLWYCSPFPPPHQKKEKKKKKRINETGERDSGREGTKDSTGNL